MTLVVERVRFERPYESNIGIGLDDRFHPKRPETTIDQHATITIVEKIFWCTVESCKYAANFARRRLVRSSPLRRHRWLGRVHLGIRCHSVERLSHGQDFSIDGFAHVTSRLDPNVFDSLENGMRFFIVDDRDASALRMILSVMSDPCLTEHLVSETQFVVGRF